MSRRLRAAAYLLSALLCLAAAIYLRGQLPGAYLALSWREAAVGPRTLETLAENAQTPVCAAVLSVKKAQAASGLFEAKLSVAVYRGELRLLTGGSLLSGSGGGCAIGEDAARALFGGVHVLGRTVTLNGKSYAVGGVFAKGQADVLIPDDGAGELRCDRLILSFPKAERGTWRDEAVSLLKACSLPDADGELDGALMLSVAELDAPRYLLPTRWSDFAGWRRGFEGVGDRIRAALRAEHSALDGALIEGSIAALAAQLLFADLALRALFAILSAFHSAGKKKGPAAERGEPAVCQKSLCDDE